MSYHENHPHNSWDMQYGPSVEVFYVEAEHFELSMGDGSWFTERLLNELGADESIAIECDGYDEMRAATREALDLTDEELDKAIAEAAEALEGWYVWASMPGCMPDSEADGPHRMFWAALMSSRGGDPQEALAVAIALGLPVHGRLIRVNADEPEHRLRLENVLEAFATNGPWWVDDENRTVDSPHGALPSAMFAEYWIEGDSIDGVERRIVVRSLVGNIAIPRGWRAVQMRPLSRVIRHSDCSDDRCMLCRGTGEYTLGNWLAIEMVRDGDDAASR